MLLGVVECWHLFVIWFVSHISDYKLHSTILDISNCGFSDRVRSDALILLVGMHFRKLDVGNKSIDAVNIRNIRHPQKIGTQK